MSQFFSKVLKTVIEAPSEESEVGKKTKDRSEFGGRPSMVSKFLGIVEEIAEFIKQNGFAAQSRSRTEFGFSKVEGNPVT